MTSSYTSRAADLHFPLNFLGSYDTKKFLKTSSQDVEKISHFFWRFALVSYSSDIVVTKCIAYNKKFDHLQIGSCKCQYLGTLGQNRQLTHPVVTRWPSNIPYFWAYEVNRWVKSYLPDGLILSVMASYLRLQLFFLKKSQLLQSLENSLTPFLASVSVLDVFTNK